MSATRFYFHLTEATGLTPSFDAGWSYTTNASRGMMIRAKYASPSPITIGTTIGAWANTANTKGLDRQYISAPLAGQTISGTVSLMLMSRMFASTDNVDRAFMCVKVINSSGVVQATLLSFGFPSGTTSTFINNTSCRSTVFANAATLTSYTCATGDRILVEIGYSNSTTGTTPQAASKWGENATDLTLGDTTTTTNHAGWIEFSAALTFAAPTVTSVSASSGGYGGGYSVTITGTGFYNGSTTVAFGSNNATNVVVVSSTQITCLVPRASAAGACNVTVTNGDATSGTLTNGFTYNALPVLDTVFSNASGQLINQFETYGATAGTYTDTMGTASDATQSTGANQPAQDTTQSPAGKTLLHPTASNQATIGAVCDGTFFPSFVNGRTFVIGLILVRNSSPNNATEEYLVQYNIDGWTLNTLSAGQLYSFGSKSDNPIAGSTVNYCWVEFTLTGASTGTVTMYINNVAQSVTGNVGATNRGDISGTSGTIAFGGTGNLTESISDGYLGDYFIGYAPTASWGSTQRAALYQAMQDWYNGTIHATANITLGDATTTATASVTDQASANITLGDVTTTATASVQDDASANITLGDATTTATASVQDEASANITLDDVTTTASLSVTDDASMTTTLDDVTAAATASVTDEASMATTLDSVTAVATATVEDDASANIALGDATTTATASVKDDASANITLGDVTVAATGTTTGVPLVTADQILSLLYRRVRIRSRLGPRRR